MTAIINLSFDEAMAVYEEVMLATDSKPAVRISGTLEHILLSCENSFNGENDALFFKAAFLLKEIISKHPFMDGNKRGALAITDAFLSQNGQFLEFERQDVAFLEEIDFKKLRVGTIKKFLEKKVKV
ncbi:MAG: Fic family protein [Candidatus Diapherotrites archaeon]|nr:Fic family protein [Candidatus Diapherotrites archaeon]